jgi:hypothetical protein
MLMLSHLLALFLILVKFPANQLLFKILLNKLQQKNHKLTAKFKIILNSKKLKIKKIYLNT